MQAKIKITLVSQPRKNTTSQIVRCATKFFSFSLFRILQKINKRKRRKRRRKKRKEKCIKVDEFSRHQARRAHYAYGASSLSIIASAKRTPHACPSNLRCPLSQMSAAAAVTRLGRERERIEKIAAPRKRKNVAKGRLVRKSIESPLARETTKMN